MNYKRVLFIGLMLITLPGIAIDLYTPSMPAITSFFHAPPSLVRLTISAFLLTYAFGQIIFGTLADIYGRKLPLLVGLFLFVGASIAAPFASDIYCIVLVRGIQGFGAAAASAIAKVVLTDSLSGKKLFTALGYLAIAWACGPILAPAIGGYLQFHVGWQAGFCFYAAFAAIMSIIIIFFYRPEKFTKIKLNVTDIVGSYRAVLSNKVFFGGVMILGLGYSLIIMFNVFAPFLIQDTLGYDAIVYGHIALCMGGAYFIGTLINRVLLRSFSANQVIRIGLLAMAIGSLILLFTAYEVKLSIASIFTPIFIVIMAVGLLYPNCMGKCLSMFPNRGGVASAALGSAVTLSTSLSTAIISLLKTNSLVGPAWAFVIIVSIQLILYKFTFKEGDENDA